MDIDLRKSIRNGLYASCIVSVLTLFFGLIYTEFITEKLPVNFENLLFGLLGIILAGVMFFIPIFVISLIYFYFKTKKPKWFFYGKNWR